MKLAGDEAKDRMYEPKYKKKLVRVLTVVAYVFFVSLAAIMLSLYYMLIWNGHQKETIRVRMVNVPVSVSCSNGLDKGILTHEPFPGFCRTLQCASYSIVTIV